MKHFFGTKLVKAKPMTQEEFAQYMGTTTPTNMPDRSPPGYLVEYVNGGDSNHENHDNYISWSPKAVFEDAYQPTTAMAFGHAVEALKRGMKVSRAGWNGKGMFLYMEEQTTSNAAMERHLGLKEHFSHGGVIIKRAHIMMLTAQDDVVPWLASQSDILADDWCIVE